MKRLQTIRSMPEPVQRLYYLLDEMSGSSRLRANELDRPTDLRAASYATAEAYGFVRQMIELMEFTDG